MVDQAGADDEGRGWMRQFLPQFEGIRWRGTEGETDSVAGRS